MKIIDRIKHFFSTPSSKICIWFDDIESFVEYMERNPGYSQRYLSYYKGDMKRLVSIISSDGEKYIPDMSLEFIDNCHIEGNNLVFEDALFFSDIASFVLELHRNLDIVKPHRWIIQSSDNGMRTIKKAVIANNYIYLCSE